MADWFSKVFGFREGGYDDCKAKLELVSEDGKQYLKARDRDAKFGVGVFSCPTLRELRAAGADISMPGKLVVTNVLGDVAEKHAEPENRNATFQVASQFNCLEFTSPSRVPEDGITGYVSDRTQGPACSIACGPATAYRNYFAPVTGGPVDGGQTGDHMLDNLEDMGTLLGNERQELWKMQGGYSMADDDQLVKLSKRFGKVDRDEVRQSLRIGLHEDVQVTATRWGSNRVEDPEQIVTQVFGSACAVAYNRSRTELWEEFATIILEASYEATLWAAVMATKRHREAGDPAGANIVYLTALGGGVFGNSMDWIETAMRHAFNRFKDYDLDIRIVTYAGAIPSQLGSVAQDFDGR